MRVKKALCSSVTYARPIFGRVGKELEKSGMLLEVTRVVWFLFGLHLLVQPIYALLPTNLELVGTLTIVFSSTLFAFTHLLATRGIRVALILLGLCLVVAGGLEMLSVATGFPFGVYAYGTQLGFAVLGVPLLVPLCWQMMAHNAATLARLARPQAAVLVAAGALVAWDVYLDPQMVRGGYWTWQRSSGDFVYAGIPLENYAGWFLTALIIFAVYWRSTKPAPLSKLSLFEALPIFSFLWTWLGSAVVNILWWGQPLVGLAGLVCMGAFALPALQKMRQLKWGD
ncbi:MAG: carotenoid biosynthesis protein [Deinococcales bacterium]